MKKVKRHAAKSSKRVKARRHASQRENSVLGVDYEFIFIAGGGFVVIALGVLLFFSNQ